ncbi:MAG: hypothetical protein V4638_03060 [Bacteroidota bacterium]
MKITIPFFALLLLFTACETSNPPKTQEDLLGTWSCKETHGGADAKYLDQLFTFTKGNLQYTMGGEFINAPIEIINHTIELKNDANIKSMVYEFDGESLILKSEGSGMNLTLVNLDDM